MFGDILVWVLTFFGLVPWEKLIGRKKDFHEQLAEFEDDSFRIYGGIPYSDVSNGSELPDDFTIWEADPETTEQVCGPWGVVPYTCPVRRRL